MHSFIPVSEERWINMAHVESVSDHAGVLSVFYAFPGIIRRVLNQHEEQFTGAARERILTYLVRGEAR